MSEHPHNSDEITNRQLAEKLEELNDKMARMVRLMEGEFPNVERGIIFRLIKIEQFIAARLAIERLLLVILLTAFTGGLISGVVWLIRHMG